MGCYTCICGKTFDNPQKFNGHKQGCEVHICNKYGSLETYYELKNRSAKTGGEHVRETARKKKESKLKEWILEKHTCETCGKVMTEKYGSGRFCSVSCGNSHPKTPEQKQAISNIMRRLATEGKLVVANGRQTLMQERNKSRYLENPKLCCVCGNIISYENRHRKTCSNTCLSKIIGGPRDNGRIGKRGSYKGIHCDSTYELVFLIYCIDNGIDIVRNTCGFEYPQSGEKKYLYYPDFYLPRYDTYIECKGLDIGPVYDKLQGMNNQNKKIKLLHYEDLVPCFEFVKTKYGIYYSAASNNAHTLYDK